MKKVCDVVSKEVAKNTKFNKLNEKENDLENKFRIPYASILIEKNLYKADKQNLETKIGRINKKCLKFVLW